LLALGLNGIVGVGIFFAPAEVAARVPGPAGLSVYIVTALALLPIALTYAALGGRFDRDGGPYVWAREAFGPRVAFGVGWIAYVSALFSTSAVVVGLAQHAGPPLGFSGEAGVRMFALIVLAVVTAVNAAGLRPSAAAWDAVTVLKLVPLFVLIAAFLWVRPSAPAVQESVVSFDSFQRAMLVVLFALQGFEIVPVPAGHVKNTRFAVPFATLAAPLGAAVLYVLLHAACVWSLPGLARADAPLVEAGRALGGQNLASLMEVGTNVSAFGICLGMVAMSPRYLTALGTREGLGAWLGREDARRVPQRALWITVLVVCVLAQLGALGELLALSSVAVLAQYGVTAAALLVLAARRVGGLTRWHMLPAPLALLAIVMIAQGATTNELLVAGGVLALGLGLLFLRRRVRHASTSGSD
ncbi:MAG TPA: APC family permease, partial [Polyangiaceae bacterium]|nr:APC family permease [Polyangiaceae bacterium]